MVLFGGTALLSDLPRATSARPAVVSASGEMIVGTELMLAVSSARIKVPCDVVPVANGSRKTRASFGKAAPSVASGEGGACGGAASSGASATNCDRGLGSLTRTSGDRSAKVIGSSPRCKPCMPSVLAASVGDEQEGDTENPATALTLADRVRGLLESRLGLCPLFEEPMVPRDAVEALDRLAPDELSKVEARPEAALLGRWRWEARTRREGCRAAAAAVVVCHCTAACELRFDGTGEGGSHGVSSELEIGPRVSGILDPVLRPSRSQKPFEPSGGGSSSGGSLRARVRAGAPDASEASASRRPR